MTPDVIALILLSLAMLGAAGSAAALAVQISRAITEAIRRADAQANADAQRALDMASVRQ